MAQFNGPPICFGRRLACCHRAHPSGTTLCARQDAAGPDLEMAKTARVRGRLIPGRERQGRGMIKSRERGNAAEGGKNLRSDAAGASEADGALVLEGAKKSMFSLDALG